MANERLRKYIEQIKEEEARGKELFSITQEEVKEIERQVQEQEDLKTKEIDSKIEELKALRVVEINDEEEDHYYEEI